eukprot:scaffold1399_cov109-Cylindrotheca_fusiformis.AAC.4
MRNQQRKQTGTKVSFKCLKCGKLFTGMKTMQRYLGRMSFKCGGLSRHLNFSKDQSCMKSYLSIGNAFYDERLQLKINLESSIVRKEKPVPTLSNREAHATKAKQIEMRHLNDNFIVWNKKLACLPGEIQQKFGILDQSSFQIGLNEMFSSALDEHTNSGNGQENTTVPHHEVTNDRLVAHFSPQALYEYLDEHYDLQPNGSEEDSTGSSNSDEEDTVDDADERMFDEEPVEIDDYPGYDNDELSEDDGNYGMEQGQILLHQEGNAAERDPTVNWELIDRKNRESQRRAQCEDAMYDISNDLSLVQLVRKHKLPLSTVKDFSEWAHTAVRKRRDHFQGKPTTYGQIVSRLHRQLGLGSTNEFRPHLINWLPDEKPITIYVRPFLDCVFELLENPHNVGPGGRNISLPHPTNPYRSKPDIIADHVSELHHGKWWSATWENVCNSDKREILVPIILYMDGVTTDTNGKLKVTPLNMTLGIFNTKTRRQASAHTVKYYHPDEMAEAAFQQQTTKGVHNVQNLHRGIARAMEDFKELCDKEEAVAWQLPYAGRMWDVRLKFSIAFVIGDSVQQDPLCGRYVKYHGIQRMCRHCNCKSEDIDNPVAARAAKLYKPRMLDPNKPRHDAEYFRSISHYPIDNAFHELCFGANAYNIHLASPCEVLHTIQKGPCSRIPEYMVFLIKNGRDIALDEISAAEAKVNIHSTISGLDILGKRMGILLGRQSDRDKPRTKFKNSLFSTAKKAGHEHAGVCLNLLLAMLTDRGRELLIKERGLHPRFLENQIYATELVLQVEEWFKSESFSREEMQPSKVRAAFDHFTTRITEICDREGSGTKTLKTHLPLHMHQYIAMWGPPTGWDSGPSESHHKTEVKLPAKNTQRREVTFTGQVSKRYHESVVIRKGEYMNGIYEPNNLPNCARKRQHGNLFLKGARFDIGRNVNGRPAMRWVSRENVGKQAFPEQVLRFLCNILLPMTLFRDQQEKCIHGYTEMNSTFEDDEADYVIFRAHPNYRSVSAQTCDIWYDWAMFHLPL